MNKKGRMILVWIYVAVFLFIVLIALIEPMKGPLQDALDGLSCSSTSNSFIKPVCFLIKGGVVLFVGFFLFFLLDWIRRKGAER